MTVCKFFLQGRCQFGRNCRFEHSYNNDEKNARGPVNPQQPSYKQIVAEVILAEKGNQWPLSCFCPVKGGSNILGLEDVSPEEVRWKMYEARANGTLNQCKQEISQLYSNAEQIRTLIKDSTMERVVVNALKGKNEPPDSSGKFSGLPSSTSIFGGSKQFGAAQNIFGSTAPTTGSHGSIFGGASPTSGNIFGGSNQQAGNIFGGSTGFPSQNIFGGSNSSNAFSNSQNSNQNLLSSSSPGSGNIFSSASISNKNIFSNAGENSQNASNAFLSTSSSKVFQNQSSAGPAFGSNGTFFLNGESKSQNQSNIFGGGQNENIFKAQNTIGKANNVFNAPQDPGKTGFGIAPQQNPFSASQPMTKEFDSSIYSKVDDLNEEEIMSFSSATFAFGKIPLKPPPMEYCKFQISFYVQHLKRSATQSK